MGAVMGNEVCGATRLFVGFAGLDETLNHIHLGKIWQIGGLQYPLDLHRDFLLPFHYGLSPAVH